MLKAVSLIEKDISKLQQFTKESASTSENNGDQLSWILSILMIAALFAGKYVICILYMCYKLILKI